MSTHLEDPAAPSAEASLVPVAMEPTSQPTPETTEASASETPPVPALTAEERHSLVGRALEAARLPRGLRECLQASLATSEHLAVDAASGEPVVRIGEFAALFEQALPQSWQLDRRTLTRPEHPEGAAFFTGDDEAASDAAAEKIARGQLARSGFLRERG